MPKRCNPYGDDFVQQSKTHIGLKQFNNSEDKLKNVYENTLQLLFQGANKTQHDDAIQNSDLMPIERKDGMKQLFIGTDGSLLRSGPMSIDKKIIKKQCACNALTSECCAYCEMALCSVCQHQCTMCNKIYCNKCSLFSSEGKEICVSCYT